MRNPVQPRGFSLLVVMGLLLVLTAAAAGTLTYIGREAALQGNTRREAEAFFAAEAGLAEGRERIRLLAEADPNFTTYTNLMTALPAPAFAVAAPGDTWFELIPLTPYRMTRGANAAIDDTVTTADREVRDNAGLPYSDYPTAATVRYHVYVRDDADETVPNPLIDSNAQVWVVSIGEVAIGTGQPVRRVTQALVNFKAGSRTVDCLGQRGGCADKTSATALDVKTPDTATGVRNL